MHLVIEVIVHDACKYVTDFNNPHLHYWVKIPLTMHLSKNITCACSLFYGPDAPWRRTAPSSRWAPTHGRSPASPEAGSGLFLRAEEMKLLKLCRKKQTNQHKLLLALHTLAHLQHLQRGAEVTGWRLRWCNDVQHRRIQPGSVSDPKDLNIKTHTSVKTWEISF